MVMRVMRAGTKPILWIVVAAFVGTIIFAWGMEFTSRPGARGVIGEVDGEELKYDDYSLLYQNAVAQQQDQQKELTDEDFLRLRDDVFNQMVGSRLLRRVTEQAGLQVSNRELAEHLRRFPPQEIRTVEFFQTDGNFDYSKYLQAYQNPDPQLWIQIEALVRPRILQQKLYEYVTSGVTVDDAEVREMYDAAMEKVRIRYILASLQTFMDSAGTVDSAAVEQYYRDHQEQFTHGDRAQLTYVFFEHKPSAVDSAEVQREALDLSRRVRGGEDFAALVRQYSEDVSTTDGDLGWFGKGAMVRPFEDAAFALDSGQVSEPVLSRFGYHVIKVMGRRGSGDSLQVNAAHILLKVTATSGTLSDLRLQAEQLAEDAKSEEFDSLVTRRGLRLRKSGLFERGQDIAGIGNNAAISEFAFNNKPGTVSGVFDIPGNYVVVRVSQRDVAGVAPLSEVSTRIQSRLRSEAAQQKAYESLVPIADQLATAPSFAEAATRLGQKVDSTAAFGRYDSVDPFGDDPAFRGAAFALARSGKSISPATKVGRGAVVMHLMQHIPADPQIYAEKRDSIMTATLQSKQQMAFNGWYTQLRRDADVKDFRYQIPGEY
ncbi:MAG: peptidylprolyl isomerase [Candidatus Zixiibacteriota bacterium]